MLLGWWAPPSPATVGFTPVSGTVTDAATDEGIAGLEVCFHWLSEGGYYCETTSPQGHYGLQVAENEYKVEFKGQPLGYVSEFYDDHLRWDEGDVLTVGSEEVSGIDAALVTGGEIQGTVTEAASGEPLANVSVCADESATGYRFACGSTDSSGAYAIPGLPGGEFDIGFYPASEHLADQFYDRKDHPWEATPVSLALDETVDGVDGALEPGARIEGTVERFDGGLVADAIGVCAVELHGYETCTPVVHEGEYAISGLWPGEYTVEFKSYFGKLVTQYWDHVSSIEEAQALSLEMGETVMGIDADMEPVPKPPFPLPSVAPLPAQPVSAPRKRRHCRRGFHKRRVAGKIRCVPKHKHRKHRDADSSVR